MIYAFVFLAVYSLRNLSELFMQHKRKVLYLVEKGEKKGVVSLFLLFLGSLVSAGVVVYLLFKTGPKGLAFYVGGIVLFLSGFVIRIAALKELKVNYSQDFRTVPEGFMVKTGIYSVVRHPIYLGYLIELAGFFVIKFNYISLAAIIAMIPVCLFRMNGEEKHLIDKYGDQYESYGEKTKRLIPFIY